jgi:hypothetical protein
MLNWIESHRRIFLYSIFGFIAAVSIFLIAAHIHSPGQIEKTWENYKGWVRLVADVLAFVASLIAVVSLSIEFQARADSRELMLSLPTRSIGFFPEHIAEITALVQKALPGTRLDIMLDVIDYASFYDPALFKGLSDALLSALRSGVHVRYLLCGEPGLVTSDSPLYLSATSAEPSTIFQVGDFNKLWKRYVKEAPLTPNARYVDKSVAYREWLTEVLFPGNPILQELDQIPKILTDCAKLAEKQVLEKADFKAFYHLLLFGQFQAEELLNLAAQHPVGVDKVVERRKKSAPFFLWMRKVGNGNGEAAFVFSDTGQAKTRGMGFVTRDLGLIEVFSETFDASWEEAKNSASQTNA